MLSTEQQGIANKDLLLLERLNTVENKDIPFVDLHVHSYYSDGTFSPEQILEQAENAGVGLLAIADHDMTEGSAELCKISAHSRVQCVPAVEITCDDFGKQVHVLAYGADFSNTEFRSFVADGRRRLDGMSTDLVDKMQAAGYPVSREALESFPYTPGGGGWKALYYFKAVGITKQIKDGFSLYDRFGCGYDSAGFTSVENAVRNIHNAGGIAIIAHPGVSIKDKSDQDFVAELKRLIGYGADGLECFYSEHTPHITTLCVDFCDKNMLLKTCGSDSHGTFLSRQIGVPSVTAKELRLGKILKNA